MMSKHFHGMSDEPNTVGLGRFAPTPSGPLHEGSLLAALASWLDARSTGLRWQLRIDDLDALRCPPGMAARIEDQLHRLGLDWDGPPHVQSMHAAAHAAALRTLREAGLVYACDCSRARRQAESRDGPDGPVYSGRCRDRGLPDQDGHALRLRVPDTTVRLDDDWLGPQSRPAREDIGDFILRRADGIVAYQLASVSDDAATGVTRVVRGRDLLASSLRQLVLFGLLGLQPPSFAHLPVLVGGDGRKLSKQNHAPALDPASGPGLLRKALARLGQADPGDAATPAGLLERALAAWDPARLPRGPSLTA